MCVDVTGDPGGSAVQKNAPYGDRIPDSEGTAAGRGFASAVNDLAVLNPLGGVAGVDDQLGLLHDAAVVVAQGRPSHCSASETVLALS